MDFAQPLVAATKRHDTRHLLRTATGGIYDEFPKGTGRRDLPMELAEERSVDLRSRRDEKRAENHGRSHFPAYDGDTRHERDESPGTLYRRIAGRQFDLATIICDCVRERGKRKTFL
ncbi:hypothetical protein A0U92_02195 [Acetobacter aceti]|uniref:Uncharacterized protein n=2 Tax=Acetobacter aceti TaxID=435 RepID=A0A1U9KDG8_ACEAC|nr:hypothetical protein A0U92_02195 [Acetobacter aceti]